MTCEAQIGSSLTDDPPHSLIHHHHCLSSSLLCFSYHQPMGHMMKVKSHMRIQRTAQNPHQTDLDLWKDLKGVLKICFEVVLSNEEIQCSSPL